MNHHVSQCDRHSGVSESEEFADCAENEGEAGSGEAGRDRQGQVGKDSRADDHVVAEQADRFITAGVEREDLHGFGLENRRETSATPIAA